VTDIFREIEEEVRKEQLEKWWKRYGDYVIAGVAAIVIGVSGYELWQRYEENERAKASASFNATVDLMRRDPAGAIDSLAKLAETAPGGYATLAKLQEADALLMRGDSAKAVDTYKAIANNSNAGELANAARLRAAWAVVDSAPRNDLQSLLGPLTDPTSPWKALAREVLAYSDYRAGALKQAGTEFQAIAADTSASPALRARARIMAALVTAGGQANFGAVPQPPAPPATPGAAAQGPQQ
jgi:hypothetical protein